MSVNHASLSASTSGSNNNNNKSWWPLRSPSFSPQKEHPHSFDSDTHNHSHKHSPGGLKSFATAIGLKSKKQQHQHESSYTSLRPPVLVSLTTAGGAGTVTNGAHTYNGASVHASGSTSRISGRPPSKSVSSTVRSESLDEDPVPKTPLDAPRNSMMTLADDPFAAAAIVTTPRSEHEHPNSCLSGYPSHSGSESVLHKNEPYLPLLFGNSVRDSYASTSSSVQRDYRSNTSSPKVGWSRIDQPTSPVSARTRVASFGAQDPPRMTEVNGQGGYGTNFASSSSSTLSDQNRLSQPGMASMQPRPPMRARGMTDVGHGQTMVQFLRDDAGPGPSASNHIRPASSRSAQNHLVPPKLSRHPSHSPTTDAPRLVVRQASVSRNPPSAPPALGLPPTPMSPRGHIHDPYSPVAPLTTLRNHSLRYSPAIQEDPSSSRRSPVHGDLNLSGKGLKKAASQSSLKAAAFNITSPKLLAEDKAPRKQRSFNSRPKSPVPLVPALPPLCSPPLSPAPLPEKRGSVSSRKRLFSGGSIRTVSSAHPGEDPYESELSSSSRGTPHRSYGQQQASNSFWEEEQVLPLSPVVQHEYTPQQIMSPAEMLKVEASHNRGSLYSRDRALSMASVASASTTRTEISVLNLGSQAHGHSNGSSSGRTTPNGSSSLLHPSTYHSPVQQHDTHHHHVSRPHRPDERSTPVPFYSPAPSEINSLPAPPRKRADSRPSTSSSLVSSSASTLSYSLSRATSSASYRTTASSRSGDYANYRKSILRKPSFLDIDDEMDKEEELGGGPPDSFLDLRPSIDSTRSLEAHS